MCEGAHEHQHLLGIEKSVAEESILHALVMFSTIMKEMSQHLQSYLCVNAAMERTHVEWETEDDVKGSFWTPTKSKINRQKEIQYL